MPKIKKPLENQEDTELYRGEIRKHLIALTAISIEAGLHSHASVWLGIHAAFSHSPEQFQIIVNMIKMYLVASESAYEPW